jgi:hypothetical protein
MAVENVCMHWTTADGRVHAVDAISFALEQGTRCLRWPSSSSW